MRRRKEILIDTPSAEAGTPGVFTNNPAFTRAIDEQNARGRVIFPPGRRVKCELVNGIEFGKVIKTYQTYAYTAIHVLLDSGQTMKVEASRVRVEKQKP